MEKYSASTALLDLQSLFSITDLKFIKKSLNICVFQLLQHKYFFKWMFHFDLNYNVEYCRYCGNYAELTVSYFPLLQATLQLIFTYVYTSLHYAFTVLLHDTIVTYTLVLLPLLAPSMEPTFSHDLLIVSSGGSNSISILSLLKDNLILSRSLALRAPPIDGAL